MKFTQGLTKIISADKSYDDLVKSKNILVTMIDDEEKIIKTSTNSNEKSRSSKKIFFYRTKLKLIDNKILNYLNKTKNSVQLEGPNDLVEEQKVSDATPLKTPKEKFEIIKKVSILGSIVDSLKKRVKSLEDGIDHQDTEIVNAPEQVKSSDQSSDNLKEDTPKISKSGIGFILTALLGGAAVIAWLQSVNALGPGTLKLTYKIFKWIGTAPGKLFSWIFNGIKKKISEIIHTILKPFSDAIDAFKAKIKSMIDAAVKPFKDAISAVKSKVLKIVHAAMEPVLKIIDTFKTKVHNILEPIIKVIDKVKNFFNIKAHLKNIKDNAIKGAKNLYNKGKEKLSSFWDSTKKKASNVYSSVKEKAGNVVESAKNSKAIEAISEKVKPITKVVKMGYNAIKKPVEVVYEFGKTKVKAIGSYLKKKAEKYVIPIIKKVFTKVGGKEGAKLFTKIPGVSLLAGMSFAAKDIYHGNYLKAALDVLSGIAASSAALDGPLGLALSVAIDALNSQIPGNEDKVKTKTPKIDKPNNKVIKVPKIPDLSQGSTPIGKSNRYSDTLASHFKSVKPKGTETTKSSKHYMDLPDHSGKILLTDSEQKILDNAKSPHKYKKAQRLILKRRQEQFDYEYMQKTGMHLIKYNGHKIPITKKEAEPLDKLSKEFSQAMNKPGDKSEELDMLTKKRDEIYKSLYEKHKKEEITKNVELGIIPLSKNKSFKDAGYTGKLEKSQNVKASKTNINSNKSNNSQMDASPISNKSSKTLNFSIMYHGHKVPVTKEQSDKLASIESARDDNAVIQGQKYRKELYDEMTNAPKSNKGKNILKKEIVPQAVSKPEKQNVVPVHNTTIINTSSNEYAADVMNLF